MEYKRIECPSIGINRTIGTNGRVECTPTQPEAIGNILSPCTEMNFTNGIPMDLVPFLWYQTYH